MGLPTTGYMLANGGYQIVGPDGTPIGGLPAGTFDPNDPAATINNLVPDLANMPSGGNPAWIDKRTGQVVMPSSIPSSGGFLGLNGGDLLGIGAMAGGAYGLGSALSGTALAGTSGLAPIPGEVAGGTSALSGSFPPGSFNVADAGVSDVPQGYFNAGGKLSGPLQGTVTYTDTAGNPMNFSNAIPFDFSGSDFGSLSGLASLAGPLLSNPALLGAVGGAALGGLGGGSKPAGNITTVQDLPDWLKPYVQSNLANAASKAGIASAGSNLLPGAQNQLAATINGNYLNPASNPALQPYAHDLMGQVGSQYLGTFGGPAGSNINNSGLQEGYTRAITNAVLPLYNSAYQTERQNQVNAAGSAPGFAGQSSQAVFGPNTQFSGLIPGLTTQSQPYFQNSFGNIASGALGGYALGKAFG